MQMRAESARGHGRKGRREIGDCVVRAELCDAVAAAAAAEEEEEEEEAT
jgi:hypothetical protein